MDLLRTQGLLRPRDLATRNIPTTYLTRMVRKGRIERIGRGLYASPDLDATELVTVAEVSKLVPNAVVCLLTALQIHELGTQLPHAVWIALPAHRKEPKLDGYRLEVVRMSADAHRSGVVFHDVGGLRVPVYAPSKTVADVFKFRSRVGIDVAIEALKAYWHSPHKNVDELLEYAAIDRVHNVMRPYVETLAT